jgi:Xaa-Pro aminopeptidase
MDALFDKADTIILTNSIPHHRNPLINKYLGDNAIEEFEGMLVLRKKGKPVWISHPFNYNQSKKLYSKRTIVKTYNTRNDLKKVLSVFCKNKVGYDSEFASVASLKRLKKLLPKKKFIDVSIELFKSREIKNKEEILKLKKAAQETKRVIAKARRKLKLGVSEKSIEDFVRAEFRSGGFGTAFCIVAFGNNAKNLHHVPSSKKLSEGPVLFDIGAEWKGYKADLSESFWFGKKNIKYEAEKKKVEKVLNEIKKVLRDGTTAKELWKIARDLGAPHSWGHGIGVEEHDAPLGIGEKSKWTLKAGMVLAIEPAVYEKFGIRIERDYLITKKGYKGL